jgi:hypothetical protein
MDAGSNRFAQFLPICAAAPALAAVGVSVAIVVMAVMSDAPPFWRGGSVTLSEAAALHDQGELVRLIASGHDPNAVHPLRANVLAVRALTPLEAAVGARRSEMVELLLRHGAEVDPASWRRLHCFAIATGAVDVVQMLDRFRPAQSDTSCEGIATPF